MISAYAVFLILGILAGPLYICITLSRYGVPRNYIFYNIILDLVLVPVCGKYYSYLTHLSENKNIFQAGFTSLGGAVGMLIGIIISFFIFTDYRWDFINVQAIAIPIMYSISKMGCYYGGCCGGHAFGIPVQLLETAVFAVIFLICQLAYKKTRAKWSFGLVLIISGVSKFILDYFRDAHNGVIVSVNQMGCLFFILLGIVASFIIIKKR